MYLLWPLQNDLDKSEVTEKRRKRGSRKIEDEERSCSDNDDDELWKSMECVTEKQTKTASKITIVLLQ